MLGPDEGRTDQYEGDERHQLGYGYDLDQSRSRAHPADVEPGEACEDPDDEGLGEPRGIRAEQCLHRVGEHDRHGGAGRQPGQQQQHPGEESDERTERDLHIRVGAAGLRDAAAGFREAQHDAGHDGGAREVGERRGGAEPRDRERGQREDPATDRVVEDRRGELAYAEGAQQSGVGIAGGLSSSRAHRLTAAELGMWVRVTRINVRENSSELTFGIRASRNMRT